MITHSGENYNRRRELIPADILINIFTPDLVCAIKKCSACSLHNVHGLNKHRR